jgi:hypothetical protein
MTSGFNLSVVNQSPNQTLVRPDASIYAESMSLDFEPCIHGRYVRINPTQHPHLCAEIEGPRNWFGGKPVRPVEEVRIWLDENAPGWYLFETELSLALVMREAQAFAFKLRWG